MIPGKGQEARKSGSYAAWPYVLFVFGPSALLAVMGWHQRWTCDDAFIDFRVVENLLRGYGPVFNVGERVEVYTNPLWVGLLATFRLLGFQLPSCAVVLGVALSAVGLAAGSAAACALQGGTKAYLPLGGLVVACLPSMWDFSSSGLETGLATGWLGLSFLAISRKPKSLRASYRTWAAVLVGLGPLIRPDLLIPAAAFILLLLLPPPRSWKLLVAWASPSVFYELFRMGYFGAVISNSAIAKEPLAANWRQGWRYLLDFASGWSLPLALVAASIFLVGLLPRTPSGPARTTLWLLPAAALIHAAFILRWGGDFMHARMLLPPLFTFLMPVFVVRVPFSPGRGVLSWLVIAAVATGAAGSALGVRQRALVSADGIADERAYYVWWAGVPNPVTALDYASTPFVSQGRDLRALAETVHRPVVVIDTKADDTEMPVPLRSAVVLPAVESVATGVRVVVGRWAVGLVSYVAGCGVHVVDRHGITDPIAARLPLRSRGRPGHEKVLGNEWIIARFGDAATAERLPEIAAARRALAAPMTAELLAAVSEPCSPRRILRNVFLSWRLTRLRIEPSETGDGGR